ncbi:hemogen isoform X2 [Dipodomys merriami]
MDLGKDQSHPKLQQTSDTHPIKASAPEIIGTWSLRNREQLRKRKAEAQEKQTSQWLLGEEKKRKRQRTGKGNQRGQKKEGNAEQKVKPRSQTAKREMEKELVPMGKEMEPPRDETEALPSIAFPQHSSDIHQESVAHQENSSEYQEIVVQSHYSETCQHLAEPEDPSPKICLEVAVHQDDPSEMCQDASEAQDHSSKECQDIAQPEVLSPKISQEMAVLQVHPLKMCQDMIDSEVSSTKVCQEVAVPKALPSTSEDVADLAGCPPEAPPKLEEPKGYAIDTTQPTTGPEELISEPDQGITETKLVDVPKNHSMKTYQEIVEPEYFSHETYEETPEHEDYSPEIFQGPEDLSTKKRVVPKECLLEPYQEEGGSQGQEPTAQEEDAKKVYTFPPEVKEKAKVEEPEISAIPHSPQEIRQENDVYSYVLF